MLFLIVGLWAQCPFNQGANNMCGGDMHLLDQGRPCGRNAEHEVRFGNVHGCLASKDDGYNTLCARSLERLYDIRRTSGRCNAEKNIPLAPQSENLPGKDVIEAIVVANGR